MTPTLLERFESLKLGQRLPGALARLLGGQARLANARQRFGREATRAKAVDATLSHLCVLAALVLPVASRATAGERVALVALAALAMAHLKPVIAALPAREETARTLGRLADLADGAAQPVRPAADSGAEVLEARLEIRGLRFGYATTRAPLLDSIDLTLEPGRQVGLAGLPGTGRSTLARLVVGDHVPWAGEVRFGGRDLRDVPAAVRARSLAWIEESPFVFEGSLDDNVRLWDDAPSAEAVESALHDAGLDEFVRRRGGVDCAVAAGGRNLSGGERQRLEIARGLLRGARLLVLDEALDALDLELEAIVRERLRRRGCTLLVISLRPETLAACDEVAWLSAGRIQERGAPRELARGNSPLAGFLA